MSRHVVLVTGPPCAGKTYFASHNAKPGDVVLDRDTIPGRHAERIMRQRIDRVATMQAGAAWVIRCAPAANVRAQLAAHIRADEVFVLRPPDETLKARAKARPDPTVAFAGIDRWRRSWSPQYGDIILGESSDLREPFDHPTRPDMVTQTMGGSHPAADVHTPRSKHRTGRPYRRARALMFAAYGHMCHLCGHPGATDADHLVPISVDSTQPVDYRLMRPAHGVRGCTYCPTVDGRLRKCNQSRGAGKKPAFTPRMEW